MTERLPIGVVLGSIGVDIGWWLESARRLDAAGYAGVWSWDHFVSRGVKTDPVLETWTTLTAAAMVTERVTVGTFVANVMNRHPAVLARMAATLQAASNGRLIVGIGIGGHPAEHEAYGIPFPPPQERALHLREAVAVLRALWSGGPVSLGGRFYPLPRLTPTRSPTRRRRSSSGPARRPASGLRPRSATAGPRSPTRSWISSRATAKRWRPPAGIDPSSGSCWGSVDGGSEGADPLAADPLLVAPRDELARWLEAGADDILLTARTTADVDALVRAADRW